MTLLKNDGLYPSSQHYPPSPGVSLAQALSSACSLYCKNLSLASLQGSLGHTRHLHWSPLYQRKQESLVFLPYSFLIVNPITFGVEPKLLGLSSRPLISSSTFHSFILSFWCSSPQRSHWASHSITFSFTLSQFQAEQFWQHTISTRLLLNLTYMAHL